MGLCAEMGPANLTTCLMKMARRGMPAQDEYHYRPFMNVYFKVCPPPSFDNLPRPDFWQGEKVGFMPISQKSRQPSFRSMTPLRICSLPRVERAQKKEEEKAAKKEAAKARKEAAAKWKLETCCGPSRESN